MDKQSRQRPVLPGHSRKIMFTAEASLDTSHRVSCINTIRDDGMTAPSCRSHNRFYDPANNSEAYSVECTRTNPPLT